MSDLERLGDSVEFGHWILELLDAAGWHCHITTPLAGGLISLNCDDAPVGVMVIAERGGFEVKAIGATSTEAARKLLPDIVRLNAAAAAA